MNDHAQPTSYSAAASLHGAATPALELLEARQRRDALRLLLGRELAAMAEFLEALADFDRDRGWEPLGHASLFAFLNVELGLSKGAAFVRSSAARLIQSFPEALLSLRDGRLCLSSVAELARVVTPDNFTAVLPRFFGCSSREAREVAAAISPREAPPVRDQVTWFMHPASPAGGGQAPPDTVPSVTESRLAPSAAGVAAALTLSGAVDSQSVRAHELDLTHPVRGLPPRDVVEPLTADLRRLHVTVSRQFLKELDAARDGLSHASPGATTEQVLEAALDLLLEKQARARGQVKRPRKSDASTPTGTPANGSALADQPNPTSNSNSNSRVAAPLAVPEPPRHRRTGPREPIPATVRRAVWARDQGRCTWPIDSGGVCGSTRRLELDHLEPWADGGPSTAEGLRVVCGRHNALAARQAFGARCVERYARGRRGGAR